ncbi:putative estradiol 17 beta-dehydrogenase [Mollisia scopiformis]|uniref:Putative estradiol 17 beta-dehydrogenase n=1 Tax=Mollisia scopiformis TaxID=149040 RepID=A0A132BAK3_MOLSC|nr:putative estradiol 17 beta-dehydrogenase [Mollisia scopiformis]KUJ09442.1 putative estradiol 17 beta-dehydrogenase [Mollisia scopiformis]
MAQITFNPDLLSTLKDKIVVLTGGATGIGLEAVKQFHQAGAKIAFGDIATSLGQQLANSFSSDRILFQHCDTSSYTSQLSLFKLAHSTWGRIDIVVANAGISIPQDPFEADQDVEKEFSTREIDVNLRGALYTTRIGCHYLRKNGKEGGDLVLVSSIAGFKESTGLTVYTASKHGVLGILRGLRVQVAREGIRVNGVCPWMTKTGMVKGIESGWRDLGLPENKPEDVARAIVICATANRAKAKYDTHTLSTSRKTHSGAKTPFWGKILFVSGGESYEIEDNYDRLEPEWLGVENSEVLKKGQDFLMNGETSWDTTKANL